MTRTYIISADGTRFIEEGASRRRRNRIIAIICLALASPFIIAAFVGIYLGATDQIPAAPTKIDSFNEGFRDAKQDDCDQGFAPACEWLDQLNR